MSQTPKKMALALIDLFHISDVEFHYWDRRQSGARKRDITLKERMFIIEALRKVSSSGERSRKP